MLYPEACEGRRPPATGQGRQVLDWEVATWCCDIQARTARFQIGRLLHMGKEGRGGAEGELHLNSRLEGLHIPHLA